MMTRERRNLLITLGVLLLGVAYAGLPRAVEL
jgi:hypothetical protein